MKIDAKDTSAGMQAFEPSTCASSFACEAITESVVFTATLTALGVRGLEQSATGVERMHEDTPADEQELDDSGD